MRATDALVARAAELRGGFTTAVELAGLDVAPAPWRRRWQTPRYPGPGLERLARANPPLPALTAEKLREHAYRAGRGV